MRRDLSTCREILPALDRAERGAAAEQEKPAGLLTVTASRATCSAMIA